MRIPRTWPLLLVVVLGSACSGGDDDSGASSAPSQVDGVAMTAAHNAVRAAVGVPDLVWSQTIADTAQGWANYLASRGCPLQHSQNGYGENIFWSQGMSPTPADVVASWAGEQGCFVNGPFDACSCECGHYSQLVWRDTQRVGCGMATCAGNQQIWVCEYDPPGNVMGQTPY